MDLLQFLILIIIAGICGAVAEWIIGYSPGGMLVSVIVGVVGAYVGSLIGSLVPVSIPLTTIEVGAIRMNLIWSVIGSLLLLLLIHTLRDGGRRSLFSRR